jgi:DNA-binding response OmpR family regulator
MPTVFVIGEDWQLRATVRAELREQGVEAMGMESLDEAAQAIAQGTAPAAVVFDATTGDVSRPILESLARRVPVIVVASRTQAAPIPESVARVLWRPVRVAEIVAKVEEVLKGLAA